MRILLATANPSRVLTITCCSVLLLFTMIGPNKALCAINLPREGEDPSNGFASFIPGVFKA